MRTPLRTVSVSLWLALGCADDDGVRSPVAGRMGPPETLTAGVALPGQVLELTVSGASPGSSAWFVVGEGLGSGPCLGLLGGECLDVRQAALLGTRSVDATGLATFSIRLPLSTPIGLQRAFQAVVGSAGGGGVETGVVPLEVQHPDDICDRSGGGTWPPGAADRECDVLVIVNALRAVGHDCGGAVGLLPATHPLTMNASLQTASRVHVDWMVVNDRFSHSSPGGPLGDTFVQRAVAAGYTPWKALHETIARGQPEPADVVADWLASPSHCQDILREDVRDLGVGYRAGPSGTVYWTAVEGEPR